jgi:CRP-like cAMP-binding protein
MAAKLQIHTPYVLQALPRPLDGPDGSGRYLAGDVFGQKQDDKRRKRTELAVAIDGVAVYLYDVRTLNALPFGSLC